MHRMWGRYALKKWRQQGVQNNYKLVLGPSPLWDFPRAVFFSTKWKLDIVDKTQLYVYGVHMQPALVASVLHPRPPR